MTDLPPNYSDFKLLMHATLPKVCDTKLMASTTPFREEIRNSSLEGLLMTVKNDPFKIPEMVPGEIEGYSLGESNEKYHEAGYDAFITGLCFIAMSNRFVNSSHLGCCNFFAVALFFSFVFQRSIFSLISPLPAVLYLY